MRRRIVGTVLEITVPVTLLAAWWLWSSGAHDFYFPPLGDILKTFRQTWLFSRFGSDVVPSLIRLAVGYAIAVAVGLPLGLFLGRSRRAYQCASPIIEFMRSLPPPALVPFGIVVLGIGNPMKMAIIALVCLFPILLNSVDGARDVDPTYLETSRVFGVSRVEVWWRIIVPASLPQAFAGMRTSLSLALIMTVIAELLASANGIGYFILQAEQSFSIPQMWAGIVLLGILGYLLNALFLMFERRVLHWHYGARSSNAS